jgi:HEPN domain-containing protein
MSQKQQETRELVGFTFANAEADPDNWMSRAREFHEAAVLMANANGGSLSLPYYYNAALSLELFLKAILVTLKKEYKTTHRLKELSDEAGMKIEHDQEITLELLSEHLIWLGRYPIPKNENQWNNFHDVLLPKHKVIEQEGSTGRIMKNEKTFPSLKNYLAIWRRFESEYSTIMPTKA